MNDGEASAARSNRGGMHSALDGAAERLAKGWGERLANDPSAGGDAGEAEAALVHEFAASLLYPVDSPVSISERALDMARALGERSGGAGRDVLYARFAHLRAALCVDLVKRSGTYEEGRTSGIEGCLDRADRLIAPLVAAAFEGACESAAADPRQRHDPRTERLVQRLRHDIKTPLQAASLNLELLALERADSAEDLEAIEIIQASIDQAVDMLRPLDAPREEH